MRVGDFEMVICGGEPETRDGYVTIRHGGVYRIRLSSLCDRDADVTLSVDGKLVGAFRLAARATIELERPPNASGRFTFYRSDSSEFNDVGGGRVSRDDRGLVVASVRVGKCPDRPVVLAPSAATSRSQPMHARSRGPGGQNVNATSELSYDGAVAGVTGLSGHSSQKFIEVPDLQYDENYPETRLTLRLRCADEPQELVSSGRSAVLANPVPPPVE